MPSPDDRFSFASIEKTAHFALFAVFAIGIHALESLLTLPVPWLRLGLSHIVTMLLLPFYGSSFILGIFFIRAIVGSALVGKLFSPGFILAFGGGLAATLAMIGVFRVAGRTLSFWGISLAGAWVHNLIQVFLAALIIQQVSTLLLLPYFLGFALVTGSVNGFITNRILAWKGSGQTKGGP